MSAVKNGEIVNTLDKHLIEISAIRYGLNIELKKLYGRIRLNEKEAKKSTRDQRKATTAKLNDLLKQKEKLTSYSDTDKIEQALRLSSIQANENYIRHLQTQLIITPLKIHERAYFSFKNQSLFLTSLILYAYLKKPENSELIIELVASYEDKKSLGIQEIMLDEIKSLIKNDRGIGRADEVLEEILKAKLIPIYPDDKKLSTYKAKLKRALFGKTFSFADEETLDRVGELIIRPDIDLMEQIATARYDDILLYDKDTQFKFMFSQNGKKLLLMNTSLSVAKAIKKIDLR